MRILYIDIDSCRPDHLGCYGYHRDTSPNIDAVAARGVRFNRCYASDVPCLPSRTSLFCGRLGVRNGVINHGGVRSQPFNEGRERGFNSPMFDSGWMNQLVKAGYYTATISPFGERHDGYHWYAGFREIHNTGGGGNELAEQVSPVVLDWLDRKGKDDNWFLHFNVWDPHTPYRTPESFGNPFADDPLPAWLTEEVRARHWAGVGPHSAREVPGFSDAEGMGRDPDRYPRQPLQADSMDAVRAMFDGYDCGVRYADEHIGRVLAKLEQLGIADNTAVIISADHGENLGELNIYGDHQTADEITTHIPLIIHWPGVTDTDANAGRVDDGLLYANDWAATSLDLVGGRVPGDWDGVSFADRLKAGDEQGREYVVVSQGAWSVQRGVRFRSDGHEWILLRSYHDGYHDFPELLLFDLTDDPHEQHNLAEQRSDLVNHGLRLLDDWLAGMMRRSKAGEDPFWTVIREGGALHTRDRLPAYLERLRATGRDDAADRLAARYPSEA